MPRRSAPFFRNHQREASLESEFASKVTFCCASVGLHSPSKCPRGIDIGLVCGETGCPQRCPNIDVDAICRTPQAHRISVGSEAIDACWARKIPRPQPRARSAPIIHTVRQRGLGADKIARLRNAPSMAPVVAATAPQCDARPPIFTRHPRCGANAWSRFSCTAIDTTDERQTAAEGSRTARTPSSGSCKSEKSVIGRGLV